MKEGDIYFPAFFQEWNAIRDATTTEQIGRLFLACLDYAQKGVIPEDEREPQMKAFFTLLSGGIDRSLEYSKKDRQKKRYARYCGVCKNHGKIPLPFDQWATDVDEC